MTTPRIGLWKVKPIMIVLTSTNYWNFKQYFGQFSQQLCTYTPKKRHPGSMFVCTDFQAAHWELLLCLLYDILHGNIFGIDSRCILFFPFCSICTSCFLNKRGSNFLGSRRLRDATQVQWYLHTVSRSLVTHPQGWHQTREAGVLTR